MSKEYAPTTNGMKNRYVWWEKRQKLNPRWKGEAEAEEQFYRWFADEIRKAKQEAWQEGIQHQFEGLGSRCLFAVEKQYCPDNPYRKGETE